MQAVGLPASGLAECAHSQCGVAWSPVLGAACPLAADPDPVRGRPSPFGQVIAGGKSSIRGPWCLSVLSEARPTNSSGTAEH